MVIALKNVQCLLSLSNLTEKNEKYLELDEQFKGIKRTSLISFLVTILSIAVTVGVGIYGLLS